MQAVERREAQLFAEEDAAAAAEMAADMEAEAAAEAARDLHAQRVEEVPAAKLPMTPSFAVRRLLRR